MRVSLLLARQVEERAYALWEGQGRPHRIFAHLLGGRARHENFTPRCDVWVGLNFARWNADGLGCPSGPGEEMQNSADTGRKSE